MKMFEAKIVIDWDEADLICQALDSFAEGFDTQETVSDYAKITTLWKRFNELAEILACKEYDEKAKELVKKNSEPKKEDGD